MTTHIALLRAVNVAGRNKLPMAPLRALLEELGMEDVRTLLQSGNAVFNSKVRPADRLEKQIEAAVAKRFRITTDVFIRTADEWRRVIAANPFPKEARSDPGFLHVMALRDAPGRAQLAALEGAIKGRERVRLGGRHVYIVYPDGAGRSKLTATLIEKHLGTRGTARNWNTVLKLGDPAQGTKAL